MSVRRAALLVCLALLSLGAVQLSGATFSASSSSFGSIGAASDLTPPTVSVNASAAIVSGTVELGATASDAQSSVASVRIEVRPAGSTTWTVLCTDSTAPYTCPWTTTGGADGVYDVRAVATDVPGNTGTSAVVQRTVDNQRPVVAVDEAALPEYLRGTATIPVLATDAGSGIASVRLESSGNGTSGWTSLCTDSTAPYSCPLTTSGSGDVFLRAVALDNVGNTATSVTVVLAVDNIAPTATTRLPATTLSGTVTIGADATDADSGIASVLVEYRAAASSTWLTLCSDDTSPYGCRFDTTTVADGSYAFRSTATDLAGNTALSAAVSATVDNRLASVSVEDPGQYLRGTVPLLANANSPSGVTSVAVQYAPAGTTQWVTVCTDTTSPYSCSWSTTTVPGGAYDLRAVMTQGNGSVLPSVTVASRIVDNALLRAFDVQAGNGGALGYVDTGDLLTLTYDGRVDTTSLLAGWDGTARSVGVRVRDGAVGGEDLLDVLSTVSASSAPVNLGTVNTRANHVKGQALLLSGTMTATTVTVNGQAATRITIRVDSTDSSGRLARKGRTMSWTPSGAARAPSGSAASTTPVEEQGALDRDF